MDADEGFVDRPRAAVDLEGAEVIVGGIVVVATFGEVEYQLFALCGFGLEAGPEPGSR